MDAVNGNYEVGGNGRLVDASADHSARVYATFTHLSLLAGHVLLLVIPALILWMIRRHESEFLDDHGREAVNFQVSLVIYGVAASVLTVVGIGYLLYLPLYALGIVGMILGARAANRGEFFRYPMTLRFLKG